MLLPAILFLWGEGDRHLKVYLFSKESYGQLVSDEFAIQPLVVAVTD
jgi:hypothetical protein